MPLQKNKKYKRYAPIPNKERNGKAIALATTPILITNTKAKRARKKPIAIEKALFVTVKFFLFGIQNYYTRACENKSRKKQKKKVPKHFNPLL